MVARSSPVIRRPPTRFVVLVFRMPAKPTAGRVAVWRLLKRSGATYLQQSVCVYPDTPLLRRELNVILERIRAHSGEYHLLPLWKLSAEEDAKIAHQFVEQANMLYDEIIEICEVNLAKQIEFETFRANFTHHEAEAIRLELNKLRTQMDRVSERDWFGSPRGADARRWIANCEALVETYEARVKTAQGADGTTSPVPINGARPRRRRQVNSEGPGPRRVEPIAPPR